VFYCQSRTRLSLQYTLKFTTNLLLHSSFMVLSLCIVAINLFLDLYIHVCFDLELSNLQDEIKLSSGSKSLPSVWPMNLPKDGMPYNMYMYTIQNPHIKQRLPGVQKNWQSDTVCRTNTVELKIIVRENYCDIKTTT